MMYDTLSYANKLKAAGAEPQLAEAMAEALDSEVLNQFATHETVARAIENFDRNFRHEFSTLNTKIDTRFDALDTKIDATRDALDTKIDTLDLKIDSVEKHLTDKIDGVEKHLTDEIDGVEKHLTDEIDGVEKHLTDKINGVHENLSGQINTRRYIIGYTQASIAIIMTLLIIMLTTFGIAYPAYRLIQSGFTLF